MHPHLCPRPWFKKISRPLMSHLTQCATSHTYTREYFKRFNIQQPSSFLCLCSSSFWSPSVCGDVRLSPIVPGAPGILQLDLTLDGGWAPHSRNHILRECPLFSFPRFALEWVAPMLPNPRWSIGHLFTEDLLPHLINFLSESTVFLQLHVPRPYEPPWVPSFLSWTLGPSLLF